MALEDMKSNLAKGAGKPLGSPIGRHEKSPAELNKLNSNVP